MFACTFLLYSFLHAGTRDKSNWPPRLQGYKRNYNKNKINRWQISIGDVWRHNNLPILFDFLFFYFLASESGGSFAGGFVMFLEFLGKMWFCSFCHFCCVFLFFLLIHVVSQFFLDISFEFAILPLGTLGPNFRISPLPFSQFLFNFPIIVLIILISQFILILI